MKAAIFEGDGVLAVKEIAIPKIEKPSELIIKVEAASVCGSDIHGLSVPPGQYMKPGIVYGHEFCGEIVEMGKDVKGFAVGERVAVNPRVRCGICYECTHNKGDLCSDSYHYGQTGDGGFAEYAKVDVRQLYHIDREISPDLAAQTEALACVMNAVKVAKPVPTDYVLLYGAGPIGLTFIRVLKVYGIKNLIVAAKGAGRAEEARSCGADIVVDIQKESVSDVIRREWPFKADLIIDAVGRGNVLSEALSNLNPQGRVALFGLDNNARSEISPGAIVMNEYHIIGVLGKDFPDAIEILKNKKLELERFITHRLPLERIHEGIDLMRSKKANRVLIYPNGIPEELVQ